jgi:preprotein translocase subunit SecE
MSRIRESFDRAGKFLREVRAELRKVIWPTRRETMVFTAVVVVSVAIVAAVIWVFDSILSFGLGALIK